MNDVSFFVSFEIYLTGTNWIKCLMRRKSASMKLLSVDVWSWVVAINCLQNVSVNTWTSVFFKMPTSSAVTFQPASIDDEIGAENNFFLNYSESSKTYKNISIFYNLQSYVLFSILLNCNGFTEMARNIKKSRWAHSKYKQFSVKKIQYFSSSCLFSNFSDNVSYCCWSVKHTKKVRDYVNKLLEILFMRLNYLSDWYLG